MIKLTPKRQYHYFSQIVFRTVFSFIRRVARTNFRRGKLVNGGFLSFCLSIQILGSNIVIQLSDKEPNFHLLWIKFEVRQQLGPDFQKIFGTKIFSLILMVSLENHNILKIYFFLKISSLKSSFKHKCLIRNIMPCLQLKFELCVYNIYNIVCNNIFCHISLDVIFVLFFGGNSLPYLDVCYLDFKPEYTFGHNHQPLFFRMVNQKYTFPLKHLIKKCRPKYTGRYTVR